jgi:hypothetical protein
MANTKRRTTEEKIDFLEKQIQQLKLKLNPPKKTEISKDSVGVEDAIKALEYLMTTHKMSMGEVIKSISRIKRTGLRIEDPLPKVKKLKTVGDEGVPNLGG